MIAESEARVGGGDDTRPDGSGSPLWNRFKLERWFALGRKFLVDLFDPLFQTTRAEMEVAHSSQAGMPPRRRWSWTGSMSGGSKLMAQS